MDDLLADGFVADVGQLVLDDLGHLLGALLGYTKERLLLHLFRRGLPAIGARQLRDDVPLDLLGQTRNGCAVDVPVLLAASREQQVHHAAVSRLDLHASLAHEGLGTVGPDRSLHLGVILTLVLTQVAQPALLGQQAIRFCTRELVEQGHADGLEALGFLRLLCEGLLRGELKLGAIRHASCLSL